MKKNTLIFLFILVFIGLFTVLLINKYNAFVSYDEKVSETWAQVENQYKRRFDLIPNLVSTVEAYAAHEKDTLNSVIEARSEASKTNINIKDTSQLASFQQEQDNISTALGKLMVVVEKYPDLKANENFMNLQVNLEGTENRIATARMDYNISVKDYNVAIRSFPGNLVASVFGFEKAIMFEASDQESETPDVEF